MSDSLNSVKHKIELAGDLRSVVRTMKTVAAGNMAKFDNSSQALGQYYDSILMALAACLRKEGKGYHPRPIDRGPTKVVVFGSDQGLVGQFNDLICDYTLKTTESWSVSPDYIVIGERLNARLTHRGVSPLLLISVPSTIHAIGSVVEKILTVDDIKELYLFYNRPKKGPGHEPVKERILPLDANWVRDLMQIPWPTSMLPEIRGEHDSTLRALLREYLFIAIYRAAADSLAAENDSRLMAMQRADRNINELLTELEGSYHRQRQSEIDEELFDVVAGSISFGDKLS